MTPRQIDAIKRMWRQYLEHSHVAGRLKNEQEGYELRRAVWAGFAKSRFWRLHARLNANSITRFVILASSIILFGQMVVGKGFPTQTEETLFFATISPLSFWYVVRQNAALLRGIWSSDWGKLGYGLFASVTVTLSKVFADQQIRLLVQSSPSLFPSAQQSITVYNIIGFTLVEIGSLIWIVVFYRFLKEAIVGYLEPLIDMLDLFLIREMLGVPSRARSLETISADFASVMAYVWAAIFLFSIVVFLDSGFSRLIGGSKRFSPTEELLLWSSFVPNQVGVSGLRMCINLEPNIWISPVNPNDAMPKEIVSARPLNTEPERVGPTHEYRVVKCVNPANPDAASIATPNTASP